MHVAAARLGCKKAMIGTGWANSRPGCMNRLRKCYSHLVLLAGKAACVLIGCLPTKNGDHCMLMHSRQ